MSLAHPTPVKKALRPLTSPLAIRDATIRDHTAAYARAGIAIDPRQIERQAVSDCEVYDRVTAAQPIVVKQTEAQLAEVRALLLAERDEEAARSAGAVSVQPDRVVSSIVKSAHLPPTGTRWPWAMGRAARLMAGATSSKDFAVMCSTCEDPALAFRLARIYADFATRHQPRRLTDEPNPFFALSRKDCGRVLERLVEDVCDASTGRMGPWFVPK